MINNTIVFKVEYRFKEFYNTVFSTHYDLYKPYISKTRYLPRKFTKD